MHLTIHTHTHIYMQRRVDLETMIEGSNKWLGFEVKFLSKNYVCI